MNELILPPEPRQSKDESRERPTIEIVIDPSEGRRERVRRRYGVTSTLLSLVAIGGVGAYGFNLLQNAPPKALQAAVTAPAQKSEAELREAMQRQIADLQTEVRDLRAKLDASDKRAAAPEALSLTDAKPAVTPIAEAPAAPRPAAALPAAAPATATADASTVQKVAPTPQRIVPGYRLREAFRSNAIVESRRGPVDVQPGDILPDAGRVLAIQKRGGRWVVATEAGDIVGETRAQQPRPPAPRRRPMMRDQYGYEPGPMGPPMFFPF